MEPHPIEHRLKMLGVAQLINTDGRPLSEAIIGVATREGTKIRAFETYRMMRDQLRELFSDGLDTFQAPLNFRVTGELAAMSLDTLPSDDQLQALEMTLRYFADDISECRKVINDHRVQVVDQALKTEPKK
jgi:hypothetical protein